MEQGKFGDLPIGTRFLDSRGLMWIKLAIEAAQCVDAAAGQKGVIKNAVHYFCSSAEVYTA